MLPDMIFCICEGTEDYLNTTTNPSSSYHMKTRQLLLYLNTIDVTSTVHEIQKSSCGFNLGAPQVE